MVIGIFGNQSYPKFARMAARGFTFPIPCLATPSQAAWYLTVALIGKTNFGQPLPITVLLVEEAFADGEILNLEPVEEVGRRATASRLTTYEAEALGYWGNFSMPLFSLMNYDIFPLRIEGYLNPHAIPYLKKLQKGIHYLYKRKQLTPANLTKRMGDISPLVDFYMNNEEELMV